jgi:hypothetical protein
MGPSIPRGFILLEQAVLRLAKHSTPEAWDESLLSPPEARFYADLGTSSSAGTLRLRMRSVDDHNEEAGAALHRFRLYEAAQQKLRHALGSGDVPAVVQIERTGQIITMPPEVWSAANAANVFDDSRAFIPTGGVEELQFGAPIPGAPRDVYIAQVPKGEDALVLIPEADLLRYLQAGSLQLGAASPQEPQVSMSQNRSESPLRATRSEVVAAYRNWIAQHEGRTPPSRADDEAEMLRRFPHLTRDRVRDLRNEFAPDAWKRRGRRKLAE